MSSDKHKVEKREEVQATPRSCFLCFLSRTFLAFHEQICQLFTCCLSAPSCLSIFCKPHFPEMGRAGFLLAYRRHWRERRRPRGTSYLFFGCYHQCFPSSGSWLSVAISSQPLRGTNSSWGRHCPFLKSLSIRSTEPLL